jgi:hypothetical protein
MASMIYRRTSLQASMALKIPAFIDILIVLHFDRPDTNLRDVIQRCCAGKGVEGGGVM